MTKNNAVQEELIIDLLLEPSDKIIILAIPFPIPAAIRGDQEKLSSFLSELRKDNTLQFELDGSQDPLKFVFRTIEQNEEYQAVIINDFQPFKTNPERLVLLSQQPFDFLFMNLPALSKENVAGATLLIDFLSATKSEKMKATLAKKAKAGIKLGNQSFGDQRGKAVRTRKLNAFKDRSMVPLRREAHHLVEEEKWSLNRVAQYFNETGKTSPKGGGFYAKTIDRLVEQQRELYSFKDHPKSKGNLYKNAGYSDSSSANVADQSSKYQLAGDSKNKKKRFQITGIVEDQNFEDTLEFSIPEPTDYSIRVTIFDNIADGRPVYRNDFPANTNSISIDLEKAVLLPGVHYLCVIPQDNSKEFEPITGLRIMLWNSLI